MAREERDEAAHARVDELKDIQIATEFYDRRYESGYMEDDDWPPQKLRRVAAILAKLPLPKTGHVLDYGCGTGVFTAVLESSLPGWEIFGTDVSTQALKRAAARLPNCTFMNLSSCETMQSEFDLIFTHHVLEHVSDLTHTAAIIRKILSRSGSMLHILPCGNPGSFAHHVCTMTRDGIDAERGGRYFFEETGHLRRLTTNDIEALWINDGMHVCRACYAEQLFGALNSATQFDLGFVLAFVDPQRAVDQKAARKLMALRAGLVMLWLLRKPAVVIRNKLKFGIKSSRDIALMGSSIVAYPLSATVEWALGRLTAWEWSKQRHDSAGSEMYIYLAHKWSQT